MGQVREVELTEADISSAINETEKEIAGLAWGDEETEASDPTGDRSLEAMGEGLEGQHEEDEDETGDEESEGESETEGEGEEGEEDGEQPLAAKKGEGEQPPAGKQQTQVEDPPAGRVPSGKLREANERARAAEERARTIEAERTREAERLVALEAQLATLTQLMQGQRQPPQQAAPVKEEPKSAPDLFENPTGFVDHITSQIEARLSGVQKNLQEQAVNTSFRIAHVRHADTFQEAWTAVNKLDPNNPDDRATAQRIYNSPDPGEALVAWHKRNETFKRVGNDPAAFEERIRKETMEALAKDPEFRKQIVASLRAEASQGDDGRPRTTTRLPTSLGRASGSNVGARETRGAMDDSEQAVSDAAWR